MTHGRLSAPLCAAAFALFVGSALSLIETYVVAVFMAGVPPRDLQGWFLDGVWQPFLFVGPAYAVSGGLAGLLPRGSGYTGLVVLLSAIGVLVWTIGLASPFPTVRWLQEGLMWFCSPFWIPPIVTNAALVILIRGFLTKKGLSAT